MRDHSPLVVTSFRGTYDRGQEDTTPISFFNDSLNVSFLSGGVKTRVGSKMSAAFTSVKRIVSYKRIGEATRLLVLDSLGQIFDSLTPFVPILSIPTMTDFSAAIIYNRAYISPHNGITGLPGEKIYVYNGTGLARPAAGIGPGVATLVISNSALSGYVEHGLHIFAVAFESSTGYISAYGSLTAAFTPGALKVDIAGIPLGPSGTVARHILVSKIIANWTGDTINQTYYFVPGGKISDNTATTHTVDFYDADLSVEASYLAEQFTSIPAGVGIGFFKAHMIVWGEDLSPSIIRVSKIGEPESVNQVEGYLTVNPGDAGGGIRNCAEYRDQLYIAKSQRSYTTRDNGSEAAYWEVSELDSAIGTECHGIARAASYGSNIEDRLFVCDKSGLRLYTGIFSNEGNLTDNILDIWSRINPLFFHTLEIAIDPVNNLIYIAVPLDEAVSPNCVLFGDYSEGIGSANSLNWTIWRFPVVPTAIIVDTVLNAPLFKFGSIVGNIFELDPTSHLDTSNAIDSYVEFPLFPPSTPDNAVDDTIYHFGGVRLRVKGQGVLQISCRGYDSASSLNAQSIILQPLPGVAFFRGFNFVSERCSVKLRTNLTSEHFLLTKFILMISNLWEERSAS